MHPPKTAVLKSEKTKHPAGRQRWMEDFKRAGDKCGFEDERLNKTGQKESF